MAAETLDIVIALFAILALAEFSFFFALDYKARWRALDRVYNGKLSATKASDVGSLALIVVLLAYWWPGGSAKYLALVTGDLIG